MLLREQRMNLINAVEDFMRQGSVHSQGVTNDALEIPTRDADICTLPQAIQQPKRQIKKINFKNLDKTYRNETSRERERDPLHSQREFMYCEQLADFEAQCETDLLIRQDGLKRNEIHSVNVSSYDILK